MVVLQRWISRSLPRTNSLCVAIAICSSALLAGCGTSEKLPDLGQVHGAVTLDGAPLANARVSFSPDVGPPSAAVTDAEGKYVLRSKVGTAGAALGSHKVEISTDLNGTMRPEDEKVPAKYNRQTTLTANIQKGDNTVDFPLTSK